MDLHKFTPGNRFRSFRCAVRGVATILGSQPNTWIMTLATVCVVVAGLWFRVGRIEWCFLVAAIFLVWVAEALNSAIEFLTDLVSPEYHPLAEKAKDAASGAVLLASVLALVTAILILGPKVLAAFSW